ncbi:MAG: DegT/DnrJ/EryC1/StrS family aminotransferase [Cytophagales bacterium]|nr:DegT/DnrJ/EryC1/StrS family aminotransferase [Cytophagales bacterium]
MSWKVKYIDYPQQYQKIREPLLQVVDQLLSQGDVMLRQQLRDFEAHFAEFVGTEYAIGISNCTDALYLCLVIAGIQPGDEVITVAHTFVATAAAIHRAGGIPVFAEIGGDHLMDIESVKRLITPKTRAIIPVHLNGRVCEMEPLLALAEQHQLVVIEDAAQALGGSYKGVKAGAFGLAGCFSFYPAKLLGTYGDAGAIVTNSPEVAEKAMLLRNHGRQADGDLSGWSFNHRMDNLHAAILDYKLQFLPEWIERRRAIASIYHQHLCDIKELVLPLPPTLEGDNFDVFQNYELRATQRDALRQFLTEQGIETLLPWGGKAIHQFSQLGFEVSLPETEAILSQALMLPMHCELEDDQVVYTSTCIRQFYGL